MADNYEYTECAFQAPTIDTPVYVVDSGVRKVVYVEDGGVNKVVFLSIPDKVRYVYAKCVLTAPTTKTRYEYEKCSW